MTATEETAYTESRDAEIGQGIRQLVVASGTNSRDHGFHDSWPRPGYPIVTATGEPASDVRPEWIEEHQTHLRMAIAEKLALVHEEISEMLGEIRSGNDPLRTYFVDKEGGVYDEQRYVDGVPQYKPEGFLVEGADAIIRLGDLSFLVGDEDGSLLAEAQRIKHEYNATRPYKHGRKF